MAADSFSSDDVLALVAHDLKSPISAVRGYLELVEQAGPLNELQSRYCQRAIAGLERMEHMIFSMLEMSRLEDDELTLELSNCNMASVARWALEQVEPTAEQHGVRIEAEIEEREAVVFGDKRLLGQVIANLLTNAIKYNREDGRVWLKLQVMGDLVRVDVRDTGYGIAAEHQPHIFDRFYRGHNPATRNTTGSGLGLTIVRSIIVRHKGKLWFESVENEGSRFTFTLPQRKTMSGDNGLPAAVGIAQEQVEELRPLPPHELSIEDLDNVDDNMQEAQPPGESDSSSDEL